MKPCVLCNTIAGERLIPGYPCPRVINSCQCGAEGIMDAEFKIWRAQIGDLEQRDTRSLGLQELLSLTRQILKTQQQILAAIKERHG